ncbi:MAG TPA: hypothetical protein VFH88_10685 [Candidatus Krumholzibacteria bacterium]|nr:hypothetical protein [Candidatus Krumholzibacteria bacterium]
MNRITCIIVALIAVGFAACSTNGVDGQNKENQPPTVWLSAAPPEGSTGTYRVHMFWGGWDPDGEIKGYEYIVTNNNGTFNPADTVGVPWSPVNGNDSTFTFSADESVDSVHTDNTKQVDVFTRSHTFFIRAIDEQGLRSKEPAYRSFTSRTLSPEVIIDKPERFALNPALVPPISTYKWHAKDYVDDRSISQDPDSVQWALVRVPDSVAAYEPTIAYIRSPAAQKEWYPFVYYKAPQDSGKFWTTPVVDEGRYVFAIRAKDEAGAITPVLDEARNIRRIKVGPLTSGPLMTVSNDYLGVVRTTSCSTAPYILDSPAGVPLDFRISATADSYGGSMAGYRYGWDISNLDDPEAWEIDLTPFVTTNATVPARSFFFGTHTLTMEVVDNSGYCSRIEVKVNIIPFTLERNVLVVDDDTSDDAETNGGLTGIGVQPTDAEKDAWWADMMSEVSDFDPGLDMINTLSGRIPLATLAKYKSIVWDTYMDTGTNRNFPLLYQYIAHRKRNPDPTETLKTGKVLPDVLALAMAAGGHIMISGHQPVQAAINRVLCSGPKYPLIFYWELEGDQTNLPGTSLHPVVGDISFAYRELCLETVDYAIVSSNQFVRRGKMYCRTDGLRPHGSVTTSAREDGMRSAIPLDPNFESVSLRHEVTDPGKWYNESQRGYEVEVYNPAYFRKGAGCAYVPETPRSCFQPIYGVDCIDKLEPTYGQPMAFWTSAYADRVADVPGAVGAPSIVFGFPPIMLDPTVFRRAMDHILFDVWQLPRSNNVRVGSN